MKKVNIRHSWGDFLKYADRLTGADKRAADMAVKAYKGEINTRIESLAKRAGFQFNETVKVFSDRENRWIEIFNRLEELDNEIAILSDDSDANADVLGAVSGLYADDGSIAERLADIAVEKAQLVAERKELSDVEDELYPKPTAYGLPRLKLWLA